jgi:hypothetical protein
MEYEQFTQNITNLPQTTSTSISTQKFDPKKYTTDQLGNIRFDFLFSYWMTIWFFLYWFVPKTKPSVSPITHTFYEWMNPILVFFLGLGENAFTFALLAYYRKNTTILLKFMAMMLFTKFLPILLLWNHPFHFLANFVIGSIVFLLYNLYLTWNGTDIYNIYSRTFTSLLEDKDLTPLYTITKTAIAFFSGKSPDTKSDFTRIVS